MLRNKERAFESLAKCLVLDTLLISLALKSRSKNNTPLHPIFFVCNNQIYQCSILYNSFEYSCSEGSWEVDGSLNQELSC
jgi:hypothetical protein